MAEDKFNVNLGGSPSQEEVAFKLMDRILNIPDERKNIDSKKVLDTYALCLKAVKGERAVK
jgi:hypothetical protein